MVNAFCVYKSMKICKVNGCNCVVVGNGYCNRHYNQIRFKGKIYRSKNDANKIIFKECYAEILVYSGKGEQKEKGRGKIDLKYIKKIENHKWCSDELGYIRTDIKTKEKRTTMKLHRFIMEEYLCRKLSKKEVIHHINCNKSDNRIENLKVMSISEHTKFHLHT